MFRILFLFSFLNFFIAFCQTGDEDIEDIDVIENKCNKQSLLYAQKLYEKALAKGLEYNTIPNIDEIYRVITKNNNCVIYKPLIFRIWTEQKYINRKAFEKYFLNNSTNYDTFKKGLFINQLFVPDINDDGLSKEIMQFVYSYSKEDFRRLVSEAINGDPEKMGSITFPVLFFLRDKKLFGDYQDIIFDAARKENVFFDLIIELLFKSFDDKEAIKNLLIETQSFWDRVDNWQRFTYYSYLKLYKLKYSSNNLYFTLDEDYNPHYNFEKFISDNQKKGLIGKNPTIIGGPSIYENEDIIKTLKDIESKHKIKTIVIPVGNSLELLKKMNNINIANGVIEVSYW